MKKTIWQNALFYAGTTFFIFVLFYFIAPELNANIGLGFLLSVLVPLFFVRRGILQEKDNNEGNINFGEAFFAGGAIYFVGILLSVIATVVFLNFQPEYKEMLTQAANDASIEMTKSMMGWFGASAEDINSVTEGNQTEIDPFSPLMAGISVLGSLFFPGAPIVLLSAAFLKNN